MIRLRDVFETASASGETPVLLTSAGIRFPVRAIVERIRPNTPFQITASIFALSSFSEKYTWPEECGPR